MSLLASSTELPTLTNHCFGGPVCRSAVYDMGSAGHRSGNPPRSAHPVDDASGGAAEGDSRLADPRGHSSHGWQPPTDQGAKCHRGDPNGVGVESSQASHGSTGCGSIGDKCDVDLHPQLSVGEWVWRFGRHKWHSNTDGASKQEGEDIHSVGPNRRDRGDPQIPCRVGEVLREPLGDHRFGTNAGSRTNRHPGGGDGREGGGKGRGTLCGFLHPYSVWEEDAENDEDEELCLSARWNMEDGRDSGTAKSPGLAGLLQGVQGSPVHVEVSTVDLNCSTNHRRPSGAGYKRTCGGPASLAGAVLRGLHGTLPGVPGVLAPADASRRQNARRKVRAPEEKFGKGSCSWEGTRGRGVRSSKAMGWGVPGGSKGSPVLGFERQETSSVLLGKGKEHPTTSFGADVRRSKGLDPKHRVCNGSRIIAARRCGKEEEEKKEGKGWQRRIWRYRFKAGERGGCQQEVGRQTKQSRSSKEMGRHVSHDPRGQASVLCLCKGVITGCMPRKLQEWESTQVHVLFGEPPEQGLPEEARKGWWERREEVGTRPRWGRRACRQRRGRGFEPRRREPSEVQISRTLCGLWRLHWGSQERMWRQGDCARCAGSMDDGVGHHGRCTFRGVEEVGQRCRPYPSCTAMQVNDEGETSGRAWISSNDSFRETTYGLGASFGGRRNAERTSILCDCAQENGGTYSLENPWDSYLWLLPVMKRHMTKGTKVEVHQCAYGCESKKATGILTTSPWVKKVCLKCGDIHPHEHVALEGKGWNFAYDPPRWVWKTSMAAEYPAGLCWAWAKELNSFLEEEATQKALWEASYARRGERGIERNKRMEAARPSGGWQEQREWENQQALGGLRNPYQAVARTPAMWGVGRLMRAAVLKALRRYSDRLPRGKEEDLYGLCNGLDPVLVQEAVKELAVAAGTDVEEEAKPYRSKLIRRLLEIGKDAEQDVPVWMEEGYPLGIEVPLEVNAIFPTTTDDTKAVEASRTFQTLTSMEDVLQAENYKSFQDAGEPAEEELERIAQLGYATWEPDWTAVTASVGAGAALTKLGCIQKEKPDGSIKTRLIVDMRRSGINGKMTIRQRVVLPRVTEVVTSWQQLAAMYRGQPLTMAVIDFKDAFYTCRLNASEKKYAVVQGRKGFYILNVVAFGLACDPCSGGVPLL